MANMKNLLSATKNIGTNLNGVKTGAKILTDKNSIFTKEIGKQMLGEAGKEVGKGLVLPGVAVAGIGTAGAGINALSKKNEKTAFDVVNESFQKIAKSKEKEEDDVIDTRGVRRNVAGAALGSGIGGALLGANTGAIVAKKKGLPMNKALGAGAALGAGVGALSSARKSLRHNRKLDKIDEAVNVADVVDTRDVRRNVTGAALGAGIGGALLGANTGMAMAFKKGLPMNNGLKAGAALGAGVGALSSARKNLRYNRKLDKMEEALNKSAFDIVDESFEKIAERMPYTTPNGNYAAPRGWRASFDSDNDDIEGTFENDFYRKEGEVPAHLKRIADTGYSSLFVDTNSPKDSPLYHEFDHDSTALLEIDDNERENMFSTVQLNNNKNIESLKRKGLNSREAINSLTPEQLKEFGYTDPTFKDKAKSFGKVLKTGAGAAFYPGMVGAMMGAGTTPYNTSLAKMGRNSLIGAGIGAALGTGLNYAVDGFKMEDSSKGRQAKIKKSLHDDVSNDNINNDFLKQYKTASELVNNVFSTL